MKKILYILFVIVTSIITGCSSTYTIMDFPSKQDFYKHFNKAVQNRCIETSLLNDTVFTVGDGAEILNDTLYLMSRSFYKEDRIIALSEVKYLRYTGIENKSADLILQDGEQLKVDDIRSGNGSLEFDVIKTIVARKSIVPVGKIKKVSYKNQWTGIIPGAVSGLCIGVVAGALDIFSNNDNNRNQDVPNQAIYKDGGLGIVSGSIIGSLVGTKYTYLFNNIH